MLVLLGALALSPVARADSAQTSLMQDDQFLIDSGPRAMLDTLATMQRLGVQTVRVNVEWANIAPDPGSRTAPPGFAPGQAAAADPASYPAANWAPYDRLAGAAPLYGISVQYNLTGPVPLWATGPGAPTARVATHWQPSATDFYDFVLAIGTRYDGNHGEPRVSQWSIWNEPNQPGWIAPQWLKVHGRVVPQSPRIYRALVNSGYYGLLFSGHSTRTDTILIGETAPEGEDSGGVSTPMTPIPFLRALYCVDRRLRPLRGRAARALGCPTRGTARAFAHANAGLFAATGFAHHPYDFRHTPSTPWPDPNAVPLGDIGRLERFLDGTFAAYGVRRRIPLYFTEYGYETRPPDPYRGVSLATQADYLNESDYLAWRNPRVRSVAQFLLVDSAPNPAFTPSQRGYWDTFQTGLEFLNGAPKPAFAAYRMPLWLPQTHVRHGQSVFVWGQVRPADALASQPVRVQWRGGGGRRWRTLATAHTAARSGYFTVRVQLPANGYVRSLWHGRISAGTVPGAVAVTLVSRRVPVLVRR
ncbi:MAG TPA: hypothetical protein VFN48_00710 [Solirubrobacteraceae bacterium]|nr:hypothetical protein [Solirubrobacteraceae bacterium]